MRFTTIVISLLLITGCLPNETEQERTIEEALENVYEEGEQVVLQDKVSEKLALAFFHSDIGNGVTLLTKGDRGWSSESGITRPHKSISSSEDLTMASVVTPIGEGSEKMAYRAVFYGQVKAQGIKSVQVQYDNIEVSGSIFEHEGKRFYYVVAEEEEPLMSASKLQGLGEDGQEVYGKELN